MLVIPPTILEVDKIKKLIVVTWKKLNQKFLLSHFLQSDHQSFLKYVEVWLTNKTQGSDPTKREFYRMRTLRPLYPSNLLILKVIISSGLFRLTHTFTVIFGSPSTRVLSSARITCFWALFIWPYKILVMCSELGLGHLQVSGVGFFGKIFGSFTYYLWSQGVTCYMFSGFCCSTLISIHIIFQLLLSSFLKYIHLWKCYVCSFSGI